MASRLPPKRWPRNWCACCAPSTPTITISRRSSSIPAGPAGRRASSLREAAAGTTDGCGIGRVLRGDLAGPAADACGDAQALALHGDTQCRTRAPPPHRCRSADLSAPHYAGQGPQGSLCPVSDQASAGNSRNTWTASGGKAPPISSNPTGPAVLNAAASPDRQSSTPGPQGLPSASIRICFGINS